MKCAYKDCFCKVSEEDEFCSSKCKGSDRSERPKDGCRCNHSKCDEDAFDKDDDDDDGEDEDGDDDDNDNDNDNDDALGDSHEHSHHDDK